MSQGGTRCHYRRRSGRRNSSSHELLGPPPDRRGSLGKGRRWRNADGTAIFLACALSTLQAQPRLTEVVRRYRQVLPSDGPINLVLPGSAISVRRRRPRCMMGFRRAEIVVGREKWAWLITDEVSIGKQIDPRRERRAGG